MHAFQEYIGGVILSWCKLNLFSLSTGGSSGRPVLILSLRLHLPACQEIASEEQAPPRLRRLYVKPAKTWTQLCKGPVSSANTQHAVAFEQQQTPCRHRPFGVGAIPLHLLPTTSDTAIFLSHPFRLRLYSTRPASLLYPLSCVPCAFGGPNLA